MISKSHRNTKDPKIAKPFLSDKNMEVLFPAIIQSYSNKRQGTGTRTGRHTDQNRMLLQPTDF